MEKTAMQELIEWIDKEIILNPYYRASPRLTEGAAMVKAKATVLLATEKRQIVEAYSHNRCLNDKSFECSTNAIEAAEQYYTQTFEQNS